MSTSTSLDGIFKRNYDTGSQVFEEQQNLKTYFWNKIKVSPMKPSAQNIWSPVTMSGNEAGSAINESQGFQNPDSMNPVQPQIAAKLVIWPFVITGTAIELSESNKTAFATGLDAQQKDNMGRIMSDLNRQSLGKGTGQLDLVAANASASTTIQVTNILRFRRGMYLDCYVSVGGAQQFTNVQVTAVNYNAVPLTITVNQAVTCNAGDILVKYTVLNGAPVGGKELSGLQAICDTTTYSTTFEGVAVATNPEWQGNVISGNTSLVSQDLLQQTTNRGMAIGGNEPDTLLSNYGQARVFLNTELQKTRYEPTKVEGGHTVLKWNDMEWLIDKDYDFNEVGMYDTEFVEKFQTRDVHLGQLAGSTLYQIVGFDMVGGYYRYQGNTGTWKRNAHSRLTNLIEPTF